MISSNFAYGITYTVTLELDKTEVYPGQEVKVTAYFVSSYPENEKGMWEFLDKYPDVVISTSGLIEDFNTPCLLPGGADDEAGVKYDFVKTTIIVPLETYEKDHKGTYDVYTSTLIQSNKVSLKVMPVQESLTLKLEKGEANPKDELTYIVTYKLLTPNVVLKRPIREITIETDLPSEYFSKGKSPAIYFPGTVRSGEEITLVTDTIKVPEDAEARFYTLIAVGGPPRLESNIVDLKIGSSEQDVEFGPQPEPGEEPEQEPEPEFGPQPEPDQEEETDSGILTEDIITGLETGSELDEEETDKEENAAWEKIREALKDILPKEVLEDLENLIKDTLGGGPPLSAEEATMLTVLSTIMILSMAASQGAFPLDKYMETVNTLYRRFAKGKEWEASFKKQVEIAGRTRWNGSTSVEDRFEMELDRRFNELKKDVTPAGMVEKTLSLLDTIDPFRTGEGLGEFASSLERLVNDMERGVWITPDRIEEVLRDGFKKAGLDVIRGVQLAALVKQVGQLLVSLSKAGLKQLRSFWRHLKTDIQHAKKLSDGTWVGGRTANLMSKATGMTADDFARLTADDFNEFMRNVGKSDYRKSLRVTRSHIAGVDGFLEDVGSPFRHNIGEWGGSGGKLRTPMWKQVIAGQSQNPEALKLHRAYTEVSKGVFRSHHVPFEDFHKIVGRPINGDDYLERLADFYHSVTNPAKAAAEGKQVWSNKKFFGILRENMKGGKTCLRGGGNPKLELIAGRAVIQHSNGNIQDAKRLADILRKLTTKFRGSPLVK